ncbi:RHS repeat-associated core domain-containing protein [Paenibacillus sp. WLX1005]|uniref:RHS repeat-associated core domain-containing protein n=1 Tax=Paenibacillus sp. WLX1005 TaxID=3243766 RepID=UPI0039840E52
MNIRNCLKVVALAAILVVSLFIFKQPSAEAALVNSYTLGAGQSVTITHSYTAAMSIYLDGTSYEYARYMANGDVASYNEDTGKTTLNFPKDYTIEITNLSGSNMTIDAKSKQIQVYTISFHALERITLTPGGSYIFENMDSARSQSIRIGGVNANIHFDSNGYYVPTSFARNASGGVETLNAGTRMIVTNRDSKTYDIFGARKVIRTIYSYTPADFRYNVAPNTSVQATNKTANNYYVYMDGGVSYEFMIYDEDGSLSSSGTTKTTSKFVRAGQRFVMTNVSATPITVSGAYPAFDTTTQVEPPMVTKTLAPNASIKVKNSSSDQIKLLMNGLYEHAEYDASGDVAEYDNGSTLSNYLLPIGNTVVFTNPSSSTSITIKVPKEQTQISDSANPALYRYNLPPGGSLEASNLTHNNATIQANGRYDYAFYDSLGIIKYDSYHQNSYFQLANGERVAFTNVGTTTDLIYAPYEAFRFSFRTQPITFKRTLESGQTIKAVNTSRYSFPVTADGQHHYVVYDQADNRVASFGNPIKADTHTVTKEQKAIVTNSDNTPLTVYGPADAFDWSNRSEPALYKGYLNAGQSLKLSNNSPGNFNLYTEGTYDQASYKADNSLRSLDHNRTQISLPFYSGERATLTNSGNSQFVLLTPYDVTAVQSSANPALLIKQLAINQSLEFVNKASSTEQVYFTGRHDLMDYDPAGKPNSYIRQTTTGYRSVDASQRLAAMNTDEKPIEVYAAYELFTDNQRTTPVTFRKTLTNGQSLNLTNTTDKSFSLYSIGGVYDYVERKASGEVDELQLMNDGKLKAVSAGYKLAVTGSDTTQPAIIEGPYDAFDIQNRTNPALIKRTLQVGEYMDASNIEALDSSVRLTGAYSLARYGADGSLTAYTYRVNGVSTQELPSGGRIGIQNNDTEDMIVYAPYESFTFKDRQHPVTFTMNVDSQRTIALVQNVLSPANLYTEGTYDYARYRASGNPEDYAVADTGTVHALSKGDRFVISGAADQQVKLSGSYDAFQISNVEGRPVTVKTLEPGESYSIRNISPGAFNLRVNGTHAYQLYNAAGTMTSSNDSTTVSTHTLQPSVRIVVTNVDTAPVTVYAPTEAIRITQGNDLLIKSLNNGQSMKAVNNSGGTARLSVDGTYDVAVYDASGEPNASYERLSTATSVTVPSGGYAILTARQTAATTVNANKDNFSFVDAEHEALSVYSLGAANMLKSLNVTNKAHTLTVNGTFHYWIEQAAEQPGNGPVSIGGGNTAIVRNTSGKTVDVYSPYGLFRWEETTDPVIPAPTPTPPTGQPVSSLDPGSYDPQTFYADPIDTSTGAQIINKTMLSAHGSLDIPFQAQYYSLLQGNGAMGKGWSHNYAMRLQESAKDGSVNLYWNDFRYNTFTRQADGSYVSSQKAVRNDQLLKNKDGSYSLNRYDRTNLQFSKDGKLQSMGNSGGITLNMQYNASGKISGVIEPATGAKLVLDYDTAGRISSVADQSGRKASFAYDDTGRLITLTSPNGIKDEYTYNKNHQILTGKLDGQQVFANSYDSKGRILKQTDGINGHQTTLSYSQDNNGFTTTITDRNGNVQKRVHDANYQLLQVQDALEGQTSYTYDNQGNRTSITNALNQTARFVYDDKNNVVKVTDPSGQSMTMTYDGLGNLLKATGPDGSSITSTYDNQGRLLTTTNPEGQSITYAYNDQGLLTSATDPRGGKTLYSYDGFRLNKVTQSTGEATLIGYDKAGRMTTQTDAAGNTASIVYNDNDQLTSVIDELNHKNSYTYDGHDNLTSVTDAKGNVTRYTYDANGQLTGMTNALGGKIGIQYDAEGRMTGVTDPLNRKTVFAYDKAGQLLSETNAQGASIRYAYDKLGRPTEARDALNNKMYTVEYDTAGNPVKMTDALGNTYKSAYNQLNQLTQSVDPLNRKTNYSYDKLGQLTDVSDAIQGHTSQAMDAFGQITTMMDANGNQAQYQYDLLGRLTNEKDAAGGSHTYEYNTVGLLSKETDKNGRNTNYTYDAAGNLIQFADQAGNVSYQYDENGNILSVTGSDGKVLRRTFDALNRVETYTDGDGNTIGYSYDAAGQLTTLTYPDGKKVHYTYDTVGHMSTVTDWNGRKTAYSYDANGRLTSTSRADGTKETRSYNAAGQLTSLTVLNPDGSVMVETSYTYDAAGNVIQEEGGEVQSPLNSVTYDVYGPGLSPELEDVMIQSGLSATAAQTEDNASVQQDVYNHSAANGNNTESDYADAENANGNTVNDTNQPANGKTNTAEPTTVTEDSYGLYGDLQLTYTADNRLATVNGQAVQYDAEGNMLHGPLNGSMQDYRYDARNRLIQAGGLSYGYDNENNRNSMTVSGVTTKQIINPHAVLSQVLMETDASGTPQAWYVYGQGLISREDASGNYQTYQYDMRGSTIALTDNKGQVTDTYTYDTYGEQLEHTGASEQPFQYNGRDGVQTDANGLYQMRARYYNPEIKRFVNRDVLTGSIDNGLTMNRYAYVNGNPVSYIDPFGLSADGATWWQSGFSYGVDALPGVGTVKGIQEVFTGVDLITGHQLSVADRIATGGGTILSIGIPGGKIFGKVAIKKTIDGGAWLIGKLRVNNIEKAVEIAPRLDRPMAGDNIGSMLYSKDNNDSSWKKGLEVTEQHIKDAMRGATLQTQQKAVSLPAINRYVNRLADGEVPPPVKVDGTIIIDGNHRYISSRVAGIEIPTTPYPGGKKENIINWEDLKIDSFDWGNH